MTRKSNILDPVRVELDPGVFDDPASEKPILKPKHAHWIKSRIYKTLGDAGYTDVERWLTLVLTGSLTTYQYSNDSDVDVSLFIDSRVFPEWSRAEMIAVMVEKLDGKLLPGTPHPMQNFVVGEGIKPSDLYKPGLRSGYNLDNGKWIVPPERDRAHDVQKEEGGFYAWSLQCADKMERLLRYEPDAAVRYWHQIHAKRQRDMRAGKGDFTESNILYKLLAQRGLFPEISQVSGEYIAKTAGVMYHVAPIEKREEIERNGLQPSVPEGGPYPHGVYLFEHPDNASFFADHMRKRDEEEYGDDPLNERDIWQVDTSGHQLQRDPAVSKEDDFQSGYPHPLGSHYTEQPIEPNRLRRIARTEKHHTTRSAGAPTKPPHLRQGSPSKNCLSCKMYHKNKGGRGKCWGYGEYSVEADEVCDSWTKETRNILTPFSKIVGPDCRQTAKFVYDPTTNRLLVGRMGRPEGEHLTHNQLFEHPMWDEWRGSDPSSAMFGEITSNGYGESFGRPRVNSGKGSLNPWQKQYQTEEAIRRTIPGVRFINPAEMLNPAWELASDPEVTYVGEPPIIQRDDHPQPQWNFQARAETRLRSDSLPTR